MDTGQPFMHFTPRLQIVYRLHTLVYHIPDDMRPYIKPIYIFMSYTVKNKNLYQEKPIQLKTKSYIVKNSKKTISIPLKHKTYPVPLKMESYTVKKKSYTIKNQKNLPYT
jgi:hypothetical protein